MDNEKLTKPPIKPPQSHIEMLAAVLNETFGPEYKWDDSIWDTTRRVLSFWLEYAPNTSVDLGSQLTTFKAFAQQMIVVRDISFVSICMHHLLPFFGTAHVAYLPHKLMIGVSKIPRIVEFWATRPQVQERLAHQIADTMQSALEPKGTAVLLEATHTCMTCRGVQARGAVMATSEMRGIYLTSAEAREEFFNTLKVR